MYNNIIVKRLKIIREVLSVIPKFPIRKMTMCLLKKKNIKQTLQTIDVINILVIYKYCV